MPTPVRGASARDDVSQAYLEFPTRSDAMMASILMGERIEPVLFDRIMKVITSDGFNPTELKLTKSSAYYVYAGNERIRQLGVMASQTQASIPDDIIEGVTEILANELDDAITANPRDEQELRRKYHKFLKEMSLVQRNWVLPCRRALGRSFDIPKSHPSSRAMDAQKSFSVLRHPFAGPWCRNVSSNSGSFVLTRTLLRERLTAVRSFHYSLGYDKFNFTLLASLVDLLPLLDTCLITLTERSSAAVYFSKDTDDLGLVPLLIALAGLSRLTHLTLEDFGIAIDVEPRSNNTISDEFTMLENSISLQSFHLRERDGRGLNRPLVIRFSRRKGSQKLLRTYQETHVQEHPP